MAAPFETAFIQHLVLPDSLAYIVHDEIPEDILPTESLRPLHQFALDYWHAESTEGTAPSPEVMRTHYGNVLAEHEIDLEIDPEDHLTYCIAALTGAYMDRHWQPWVREFAGKMTEADVLDKPEVIGEGINFLMSMATKLAAASEHQDLRAGMGHSLAAYHRRATMRLEGRVDGIITGFPTFDDHTLGIRPGELMVLAAPPKTGKSFFLAWSALQYWNNGGVPVLFSLENSVELTIDRLACMALGIDSRGWQRGTAHEMEIGRVEEWISGQLMERDRPFHILQPGVGQRNVESLVRRAKSLGDGVFIDQLTFVEPEPDHVRLPRYQQVGHSLHILKALLSSGQRMPCMLAHQINREGQKAAQALGYLEMYHLAESAEVERTADWVFGLFQTPELRDTGHAYLQSLASRREDLVDWQMNWEPWRSNMSVNAQVQLRDAA